MNTRNPKFWALIGFGVGAVIASAGTVVHPLDALIGGLIQAALWFGVSSFVIKRKSMKTTVAEKTSSKITSIKSCDKCGKELEAKWGHCPACLGTTFTSKSSKLNSFQEPPEEEMIVAFSTPATSSDANLPEVKVCPMCAEQIKYAAKKCRYCQHLMGD